MKSIPPYYFFVSWQIAASRLESSLIIGIELGSALARDLRACVMRLPMAIVTWICIGYEGFEGGWL